MIEEPFRIDQFPARPPLRLALVTETYPPEVNGVAMTTGRLVEGLLRRRHQIQLIRPRQRPDDAGQQRPRATAGPQGLQRTPRLCHASGAVGSNDHWL